MTFIGIRALDESYDGRLVLIWSWGQQSFPVVEVLFCENVEEADVVMTLESLYDYGSRSAKRPETLFCLTL